jgi:hypothetical protein
MNLKKKNLTLINQSCTQKKKRAELETYVTPTNALFYISFVLSYTQPLHVSALSCHFQAADTKVSIKLAAIK